MIVAGIYIDRRWNDSSWCVDRAGALGGRRAQDVRKEGKNK